MPSSSIIIPVHNRAPLTRQCLKALLAGPYAADPPEIIVVDDASTDLTSHMLAGFGAAITTLRQSANLGFATACNLGAAASRGDCLVFLNNDTLPQPGWLDALLAYAEAHPAAGAIGAKLLFPNDTIQHAGVVICQDHLPRHVYMGFPADHPAVNKSRRFPIVTGACLMVRRSAFAQANGFDTGFYNAYEDVDLCLRLGELGHEVHYCHESVLYHFESATRSRTGSYLSTSANLYAARWRGRVQPDDMHYYLEDGLLSLDYHEIYPIGVVLSPLLGLAQAPAAEPTVERLLNWRSQQVLQLLRETASRSTHIPLPELVETVTVPSLSVAPTTQPDADLMHPLAETLVGQGDPWAIGRLYLSYFRELGALKPSDRVLDVGCGVGRMALPLAQYLDAAGSYEGFDIVAASVAWCQERITARYPRFRFQHADVRNLTYNPGGQLEASTFTFPYPDGEFDFAFLTSVFTHMLPADVEHYVAELARVLKPGGRCLLSVLLTDPVHQRNLDKGQSAVPLPHDHGFYRTMLADRPEEAVAYDPAYLCELLARNGLVVQEPLHFGNWSGSRPDELVGQDVVVAVRQAAVGLGSSAPASTPPVLAGDIDTEPGRPAAPRAAVLRRRPRPNSAPDTLPLPPDELRFRAHGAWDADGFLQAGKHCADDLFTALGSAGRELGGFKRILDFGCGCGRTLRWLLPRAPRARFFGTDTDVEAIAWCRANVSRATFLANNPLPPLPYPNATFDLIYAISVLTHLDEAYQFQWLAELRRVTRPGGFVLVSLHGDSLFHHVPASSQWQLATNGFAFVDAPAWRGIFPDWYQTAYHSHTYVMRWYPRFFRIVAHLPQGLANHQDLVVMQRER